jgi:hypothetical protein
MAGHESSMVRPKSSAQDTTKIAAGSPLAVQGIFLEILRERFSEGANLDWVWRADPTLSDIIIEVSYNGDNEIRNTAPAIYVTKLDTIPGKVVLGDRAGVRLKDHTEGFGAIVTVGITLDCVSNDEAESTILGDIVQYTILTAQDVIQTEFGFYDISQPMLSQTTPFDRDQKKWNTQVSFQVQFWVRWKQVPIRPLLQQITHRIISSGQDANAYFTDSVINSMRRGSDDEDTNG